MDAKTVVLKIDLDLYKRLDPYAKTDSDKKFLMVTGITDYVNKREARTRRAEAQRAKYEK